MKGWIIKILSPRISKPGLEALPVFIIAFGMIMIVAVFIVGTIEGWQ